MIATEYGWGQTGGVCLPRGLAAVRGRVFILYHPCPPTVERARREGQAYVRMCEHFESMVLLLWLGQPFPPLSEPVRAVYADHFGRGPRVEAAAWVMDCQRSQLSFGRSLVTSMSTQILGAAATCRVFTEPFEATTWLSGLDGVDADLESILDGLDTLDRAPPETE